MNWHFWKSVAAQPRGGFSLKAAVLGPGSSASICSRRSVCKHGRSPDQTPLNQTAKSLANAWLSLPTVWLRVCVRSSTEKERWHDCARWFKSASSHYLVLAFTLENIQTWGSGCRTLPEWSAGMARCLFFYSALRLQIHKSVPTPAHTPAPSHPLLKHSRKARSGCRSRGGSARQDDSSGDTRQRVEWQVQHLFLVACHGDASTFIPSGHSLF